MINEIIPQKLLDPLYDELKSKRMEDLYLSFPVLKSNGKKRWISAPEEVLKDVQKSILHRALYKLKPHPCCVGFTPHHGIKLGADKHLGAESLLNVDIRDFFDSVPKHYVKDVLKKILCLKEGAKFTPPRKEDDLERLLFSLVTLHGRLPQGAPTSPYISNLAFYNLDVKLNKMAQEHELTYTRYADDLSFSSRDKSLDMLPFIRKIDSILSAHSYRLNGKKSRIQRKHRRMTVTGVVVNKTTSVPKWKRKNIRAAIHNYKNGNQRITPEEKESLVGYCEWIRQLNPKQGDKLKKEAMELNDEI